MSDNICICIPARLHSTRLNEKLLLKFNKKTCLEKTIENCLNCKLVKDIYVLTDSNKIINTIKDLNVNVIFTEENYKNGTERIAKNLNSIPSRYNYIVNIQADEPYISSKNIDFAIKKHLTDSKIDNNIFYTTLHEQDNTKQYLKSTASLKLVTDINNNVLYYSRNIIPWNKDNCINNNIIYNTFTGIYVYNRNSLIEYSKQYNTYLQNEEDCEQLKVLENGYKIKSYPTIEYNEISLNTKEDYSYLLKKYVN